MFGQGLAYGEVYVCVYYYCSENVNYIGSFPFETLLAFPFTLMKAQCLAACWGLTLLSSLTILLFDSYALVALVS